MARVEMTMPKMGESIMEGTVLKWLKQIGDAIEQDEAVLEVATDKVDTEVPALYAGTLATLTALWVPPLFGGIVILGLVGTLVRFTPRFRAYDALDPQP